MSKYAYPAIFTPEAEGGYSVDFPDLQGCYTCGDTLAEALYMAEDVLAFSIYCQEKRGENIAAPSDSLTAPAGSFVNWIACDTTAYYRRNNQRAVKKTLTIPEWLNDEASAKGMNFSQVLQEALKERLGIDT